MQTLQVDIAIIGGGIAGLWLLACARRAGYNAVLFERAALGSGQTVASQGMIHGGVKYTLSGALSGASEAIADMPAHWRRCIKGEGDVDLRGTRVLSEAFYMWSPENALSKVTAFFASKALRGRVDAVKPKDYPAALRHEKFRGSVYRLLDMVVDAPSLLETLRAQNAESVFSVGDQAITVQRKDKGADIFLQHNNEKLCVSSQLCVLAAGKGNGELLQQLAIKNPVMQLRPLQQVMVRHPQLTDLYAHCVGKDSKPRLTISSHVTEQGVVWYLGGQLAEDGAALSGEALIKKAKQEMEILFAWIKWSEAQWSTFFVERAEPQQPGLLRPDNAWLSPCDDLSRCVAAWPTKLTLVPHLGVQMMNYLRAQNIAPQNKDVMPASWPRMTQIAAAPWQSTQWQQV